MTGDELDKDHASGRGESVAIVARPPCAGLGAPRRHFATLLCLSAPIWREGKELYPLPIALTGAWVKGEGKFSILRQDLEAMVQNFEKRKNEQVVIDFEHASEMPEVAKGGPVPAAGWIHSLSVRRMDAASSEKLFSGSGTGAASSEKLFSGSGMDARVNGNGDRATESGRWALDALVEWTAQARGMIRSGQYRFFSPAIDWGARDKETGEPQGATLTSGALTNHPFLEELPPLMLTEFDISNLRFQEGGKEVKKLTLRKSTSGQRAVFDDAGVELGEFALDELDLDDGEAAALMSRRAGGMSELFAERIGAAGKSEEEIRQAMAFAEAVGVERAAEDRKRLLLKEAAKNGRLDVERVKILAREQKITLEDFVAAEEVSKALDKATEQGKILPRDRQFFFEVGLADPERLKAWLKDAPKVIHLGMVGIGVPPSGNTAAEQMTDLTRAKMNELKITFSEAARLVARENPELAARYRKEVGRE